MSPAAESDYEVLIEQWTPKIHRMLRNVQIQGYTTDDLVQELTIEMKSWIEHSSGRLRLYLSLSDSFK